MLHHQATTELEQGLTVAVGQLIEDGPPGGIGKGLEHVQDDSIGKWLLACQARGGHLFGFALRSSPTGSSAIWISGDTVLYDGVRSIAGRIDVDIAVIHLGAVQFPVTGPFRYTMTARDAVEVCALIRPRVAIPVHYEGWRHFHQGRTAIEREFAAGSGRRRSQPPVAVDRITHRHPPAVERMTLP